MDKCDNNIIETIQRLIYECKCNRKKPKYIFISKGIFDLLKAECRLTAIKGDKSEIEYTLYGLKIYEVYQEGVIKVTD